MPHSLFNQYSTQLDSIKNATCKPVSNIYDDSNTIKAMCSAEQTQYFSTDDCILLFTIKHNLFYECWYTATDNIALEFALQDFLKQYNDNLPIRFTLIEKDAGQSSIGETLNKAGCTLHTTLARRSSRINETVIKMLEEDYTSDNVEYAKTDDAKEIFELLSEEFDVFADNLPELVQIEENIRKQQVVIIRKDAKIALAHYFEVKNNILYGYYDVVREEYRKDQLYFSLVLFLHTYIQENNIRRSYDWRNTAKKRLAKNPALSINEKATIYIHFYVYTPTVNIINEIKSN